MASRSIGKVTHDINKNTYAGEVRTLAYAIAIEITPNTRKEKDTQPDFLIYCSGLPVGAGWLADAKDGMDYRSINCRIDDPSFSHELRFSTGRMYGQDDPDVYSLIWNRQAA